MFVGHLTASGVEKPTLDETRLKPPAGPPLMPFVAGLGSTPGSRERAERKRK